MNNIKGIPYLEVVFDKDGKRQNTPVVPNGTTDLIVMSHGWNNTAAAAEDLSPFEPTDEDQFVGRRDVEKFTIHFTMLDLKTFRFQALGDRVGGIRYAHLVVAVAGVRDEVAADHGPVLRAAPE